MVKHFSWASAVFLVVMHLAASSVGAQSPLPDLSLEDLMKLDAGQVFGASERLQPVMEAPSSISFITAKEIALNGYRTLGEILQGVRGMYVTNDRNFSFIGTRGFGKPGDYNSRILLLINGHRVNDNVFGQAEIGAEFGLDPAMFERVEVIRGPSSSLYGDSAFFAVVNVITRNGASLDGISIAAEAGTMDTWLTRMSAGHVFSSGADLALSATYQHTNGVPRLYFPEFDAPESNNGVAEGLDGEGARQFYGRFAFKGLTVTGAYGTRQRDVPTASVDTVFNEQLFREETTDRHKLLDAEYARSFGGTRATVRASFDGFSYNGVYPVAGPDNTLGSVQHNSAVGTRWSIGGGVTRSLAARQTLTAGIEFINNIRQDQAVNLTNPPMRVFGDERSSKQHGIYVQDEIKLTPWLILNGGLRYDGYEEFSRVTPRAALIILPSSTQSLKYLYGRAFRAPNAYELTTFYFGDEVSKLRPESIDTHELVWERYVNDWLRTSISTYWYKADRLITQIPDDSTLLLSTYRNQGAVRAKGLELEAQMRLKGEGRLLTSYSLQSAVDQETHTVLPNSPRHLFKVRISLPVPRLGGVASLGVQYFSSRTTVASAKVPGAATVNLNVVRPIGGYWELFGGIQNIFNTKRSDPASSFHRQDAIPQNGRTARIGIQLKFGAR